MSTSYRARHSQVRHHARFSKKRVLTICAILLLLFIVANAAIGLLYRNKVYPGYYLGTQSVGGMRYDQISHMDQSSLLPAKTQFRSGNAILTKETADFGITVDRPASIKALKSVHSWLPLVDMLRHPHVALVTNTDEAKLTTSLDLVVTHFTKPALDKRIVFNGSAFVVASPENGRSVNRPVLKSLVTSEVVKGKSSIKVPVETVKSVVHDTDLSGDIATLTKQTATAVKLIVAGQTVQPSLADKAGWYAQQGQTMVFSSAQAQAYINNVAAAHGVTAANADDLAVALNYSLSNQQSNTLYLVAQSAVRVRTYCTAAKGVSEAGLATLNGKLATVYADSRGWSNGILAFRHVDSGCEFTVWLTASSLMTTFGAICDDYYNCQVGSNVVVNYDRWQSATDPWNATGQSLEEYRNLIINHETGHRLGFRDNNITCTQPGQLAPVMMQQSIALNGCSFNVWPTAGELTTLKAQL